MSDSRVSGKRLTSSVSAKTDTGNRTSSSGVSTHQKDASKSKLVVSPQPDASDKESAITEEKQNTALNEVSSKKVLGFFTLFVYVDII